MLKLILKVELSDLLQTPVIFTPFCITFPWLLIHWFSRQSFFRQNLDGKLEHLVGLGDLVEFVGLVDDLAGPVDLADTGDRAAPVDFDPDGLDPGDLD